MGNKLIFSWRLVHKGLEPGFEENPNNLVCAQEIKRNSKFSKMIYNICYFLLQKVIVQVTQIEP